MSSTSKFNKVSHYAQKGSLHSSLTGLAGYYFKNVGFWEDLRVCGSFLSSLPSPTELSILQMTNSPTRRPAGGIRRNDQITSMINHRPKSEKIFPLRLSSKIQFNEFPLQPITCCEGPGRCYWCHRGCCMAVANFCKTAEKVWRGGRSAALHGDTLNQFASPRYQQWSFNNQLSGNPAVESTLSARIDTPVIHGVAVPRPYIEMAALTVQ